MRVLSCPEQFRAIAFAQLTYRESLRDIEICLQAHQKKLYGMGFHSLVKRSTLADANEGRDWHIWEELATVHICRARKLYCNESFGIDLANTVYALDATTIDLCLSLFPWASFRSAKAAVKMHTLLDLRGNIPAFIHISDGKMGDVNVLDTLTIEVGAFYVMDRGYLDFTRLYTLHQVGAFFVTRAKRGMSAHRVYSMEVDRSTGIICDQRIALDGFYTSKGYPEQLRRIRFKDPETGKTLVFLTNNLTLPGRTRRPFTAAIQPINATSAKISKGVGRIGKGSCAGINSPLYQSTGIYMSRALIPSTPMSITNLGDSGIMKKFTSSLTACAALNLLGLKRAVFILGFFASTGALAGPSLINASFETNNLYTNPNPIGGSGGYLYGAQWSYLGPVAVSAPGWSFKGTSPTPLAGGSGLSYSNTAWGGVASDGNTFAFLQNKGEIVQSFTSASAENYQFSFDLVQRTTCCGYVGKQSVSVELDGNVIWSGTPGLTWSTVTVNALDIASGNHTLSFFGTNPFNVVDTSAFLDNVVMTATPVPAAPVPEPETYAMMMVGLGLLGAIGRRRVPKG